MTPAWLLGKKVATMAEIRSGRERLPASGGVRTGPFRVCKSSVSFADWFPFGRAQARPNTARTAANRTPGNDLWMNDVFRIVPANSYSPLTDRTRRLT